MWSVGFLWSDGIIPDWIDCDVMTDILQTLNNIWQNVQLTTIGNKNDQIFDYK